MSRKATTDIENLLEILREAYPGRATVKYSEATKITGISNSSLYRLAKVGALPVVTFPGSISTTGEIQNRDLIDIRPRGEKSAA